MNNRLPQIGAGLVVLAAAVVAWLWWGPGPAGKNARIAIPEGVALQRATDYLHYSGVVGNRTVFYYLARLLGGGDSIQAGEFDIPPGASYATILDIIQHGRPVVRLITIPEGMPSILVQEKLQTVVGLTGKAPLPEEGTVLPNSYDWQKGESRAVVVGRMQAAMTKTLDQLWATKKGDCPVATKQEAVILASIVEKETGKPAERRTVAGVYCNRLKVGMKLDADPTVIYPVTKGKPLGRRIKRSELDAITGYNTYREPGLPDGPIANPGRESIAAVLDPAPTKALYFVADGSGGHVFAETLQEHNANVKKWYAIRRQRGEM